MLFSLKPPTTTQRWGEGELEPPQPHAKDILFSGVGECLGSHVLVTCDLRFTQFPVF